MKFLQTVEQQTNQHCKSNSRRISVKDISTVLSIVKNIRRKTLFRCVFEVIFVKGILLCFSINLYGVVKNDFLLVTERRSAFQSHSEVIRLLAQKDRDNAAS